MGEYFDEMNGAGEGVRAPYARFEDWFQGEDLSALKSKQREAEEVFRLMGITFNVYGEDEAEERLIPFYMVPRIITAGEWRKLTRGIEQRVRALNAFLYDLYHRPEIFREVRVTEPLFRHNDAWLPHMVGFSPSCHR